ncbi:MAG: pyridoxamine 5'-phosphate oxidase [Thermoanaerobaculia bacterium]|nr:pyridoxamine 5'-phosphate oxidase [Thermoanaerobaculia bacterium]
MSGSGEEQHEERWTSFAEPFERFGEHFEQAEAAGVKLANAMSVATVSADGRPASRQVLLKGYDRSGFVFYTNLESRKGRHIEANCEVALLFYWRELDVQIQIEGTAEVVSDEEADAYFATRPRGSQLGAWASKQSRPLPSRARLLAAVAKVEARYLGRDVPRPPHWSGFRVVPRRFEFWRQGAFRLHHRTLYERSGEGWRVVKLYP